MERVTGIGGIFFKSEDPKKMMAWYQRHLGIRSTEYGAVFEWRGTEADGPADGKDESGPKAHTVWGPFPQDTKYFEPSKSAWMINYRVRDLDAVLKALRDEGVTVDDKVEDYEYGRFGWIMDPEGNRIELWEPAPDYVWPEDESNPTR